MAEYIDRESIYKTLSMENPFGWNNDDLGELFRQAKPADVAPVRHGRWIEPTRLYYGAKQYECSICYSDTFWKKHSITEKYTCCPNCGAKMDLEDAEKYDMEMSL